MSDTAPPFAARSLAPGVSWQDVVVPAPPPFLTGVPAFLGYTGGDPGGGAVGADEPVLLTLWPQFERYFGPGPAGGHLAPAVRGFFENGGLACYVVRLREAPVAESDALASGLAALTAVDAVDLVCAPDITGVAAAPHRRAPGRPPPPSAPRAPDRAGWPADRIGSARPVRRSWPMPGRRWPSARRWG